MEMTGDVQDILVGTVLMLSGIMMTVIASKTEMAWNWSMFNWDDEIEYYGWIDRIGQLGIVYFLTGISWAIGDADLDQMLWVVWAAFLSGIAIQGFRDETETPWRRGIGSMGTIFALFMLSLTFDTDLYTHVTWMFMGVVALGFGFAYVARMGEVSTIFTENFTQVKEAIIEREKGGNQTIKAIPEQVISQKDSEEEMPQENDLENVEEDSMDDEEVIDIDEDKELAEIEAMLEQEIEKKNSKKAAEINEEVVDQKMFEYDLLLDPSVTNAIQKSLANTPHEGFKPVVSIAPNGNLKIDFVPL